MEDVGGLGNGVPGVRGQRAPGHGVVGLAGAYARLLDLEPLGDLQGFGVGAARARWTGSVSRRRGARAAAISA